MGDSAIFVGADLRGQSSSVSTLNGRSIQFRHLANDRNAPGIGQPFVIPSYTVVDARAGYEFGDGNYKIMVWGKNVFNKYYVINNIIYMGNNTHFQH